MHAPGYGFLPEEAWRRAWTKKVLGLAMFVMTNICHSVVKYLIFLNIKIRTKWVTLALADLTKCFIKQYGVVLKSGAINPKQPIIWVRFGLSSSVARRGFRRVVYTTSRSKSNEKQIRLVGKYRKPFSTWSLLFLVWSHMWSSDPRAFPGGGQSLI